MVVLCGGQLPGLGNHVGHGVDAEIATHAVAAFNEVALRGLQFGLVVLDLIPERARVFAADVAELAGLDQLSAQPFDRALTVPDLQVSAHELGEHIAEVSAQQELLERAAARGPGVRPGAEARMDQDLAAVVGALVLRADVDEPRPAAQHDGCPLVVLRDAVDLGLDLLGDGHGALPSTQSKDSA